MPSYYAVRLAGWEVLALNSETPHGARSPQLRWLRARLRRGRGTCRLAVWHRPRFSAGSVHGDSPDVAPLWRAIAGKARLVLGAHDHNSQRLRRVDGMTSLVAGGGGHGLYRLRRGDRRLAFGNASRHAALRLILTAGSARVAFVAADGSILDRATVRCRRL